MQQHQQSQTQSQAIKTAQPSPAVGSVNLGAGTYHTAPTFLPNTVDMSSFQSVDWSSMYGHVRFNY